MDLSAGMLSEINRQIKSSKVKKVIAVISLARAEDRYFMLKARVKNVTGMDWSCPLMEAEYKKDILISAWAALIFGLSLVW